MECLFSPEFNKNSSIITIEGDEAKHAKALRLKINDEILITNGKGLTALCKFTEFNKFQSQFHVIEFFEKMGEPNEHLHVAIGILDNKDRFEFALEKAVELGISEFTPLITRYSKNSIINSDRLFAKSVAALKQSKRSVLPVINQPIKLEELLKMNTSNLIVADENGTESVNVSGNMLLLVGPEGGFSNEELMMINKYKPQKLNLGARRLRAETALIASIVKIFL